MRARLFLGLAGLALTSLLLYVLLVAAAFPSPGAAALLVILVAAGGLAYVLSRPVRRAAEFASALNRGEQVRRLPETRSSDLGDLYRALNRIAESQRLSLDRLVAEKAETDLLLSEMGEGVLAVSAAGTVVRANAELRTKIGALEPLEGRSLSALFRNPALVRFLAPASVPEAGVEGEFEVFGRTMLVSARRLPPGGGVAVFSDVTELRRLDRVRTEFVSNASHELKTPLTAVRGYAETLLDPAVVEPERRRFLERIVDNAARMTAIVEDLLTLAGLEDPNHRVRRERIALRPFARAILDEFAARARAAGVETRLAIEPEEVEVAADPEGLRQVLENLLDNALRHSGATEIAVAARALPPGKVELTVDDTGRGIPSAHLERIFERFYRVDPSRSRETGDTGLGLSIVRHWVETMGGAVHAESELGVGTRVRVLLPGPHVGTAGLDSPATFPRGSP